MRKAALSLSKRFLISWWVGKQAPSPLHPHQFLLESFQIFGRKPARKRRQFLYANLHLVLIAVQPCGKAHACGGVFNGAARAVQFQYQLYQI